MVSIHKLHPRAGYKSLLLHAHVSLTVFVPDLIKSTSVAMKGDFTNFIRRNVESKVALQRWYQKKHVGMVDLGHVGLRSKACPANSPSGTLLEPITPLPHTRSWDLWTTWKGAWWSGHPPPNLSG